MIIKTKFKGLYVIKNQIYNDDRGSFMEILKNKDIKKEFPFIVCSKGYIKDVSACTSLRF